MDEVSIDPEGATGADPAPERRRVRRRRSSRRSRRSTRIQSRIPFTSLRFSRPRLPTPLQGLMIVCTVAAFGMAAKAIQLSGRAGATLTQTRELLAFNTRAAAAGRLAADQLEAQVRSETSAVLASQDAARRAAQSYAEQGGFAGAPTMMPAYAARSDQDAQGPQPSAGFQLPFLGGQPAPGAYGGGAPAVAPASQGTMGYTLPSSNHPTGYGSGTPPT